MLTSPSLGACSTIVTRWPARTRAIAAESPPNPAPTTATLTLNVLDIEIRTQNEVGTEWQDSWSQSTLPSFLGFKNITSYVTYSNYRGSVPAGEHTITLCVSPSDSALDPGTRRPGPDLDVMINIRSTDDCARDARQSEPFRSAWRSAHVTPIGGQKRGVLITTRLKSYLGGNWALYTQYFVAMLGSKAPLKPRIWHCEN